MRIESTFEVPAPVGRVWDYLLDAPKVVACMPGASLTETVDDSHFKGKVTVKLGPVSLVYAGTVEITERDEAAHRIAMKASGMEQRGKGAATAAVTMEMEERNGTTRVNVAEELTIQGQAAQYGRGMIEDITHKLSDQFADCLAAAIGSQEASRPDTGTSGAAGHRGPGPAARTPEAIGGLGLGAAAMWGAFKRFVRKIFSRSST